MAQLIDTLPRDATETTRPAPRWVRGTRRRIARSAGADVRELVVLSRRPRPRPADERAPRGLARAATLRALHALRAHLDADVAALAVAALMLGTLLYA